MSNRQQNRQFDEAVRQIEKILRRKLDSVERRRFHDEVTRQGYTLQEIIDIGLAMFPK
jgi:hypothetical protein